MSPVLRHVLPTDSTERNVRAGIVFSFFIQTAVV
jgi:hypothetical protein